MATYLRRVRNFSFDIKLFLLYNLLANIGFGVIELVFNFYLLELGYREDFIGDGELSRPFPWLLRRFPSDSGSIASDPGE